MCIVLCEVFKKIIDNRLKNKLYKNSFFVVNYRLIKLITSKNL